MVKDKWYYPDEIANDLRHVDLPAELKAETFACAWEYTRCVIPQYSNWKRYVAFMRIIIMGIVAEFRGSLVDVTSGDDILGYSLDGTLAELLQGTPGHHDMAREYKTFLLVTSEKTSGRRDSELFRRYVNALASKPHHWFRLRDCDALARFSIAAALACNDFDQTWFTDKQFNILTEIGDTLYDAVAFYKHRAEGETNNTFAYVPADKRVEAFRTAREVLWALDVANAKCPEHLVAMNFIRFFGGPIHMMMRRYRFVEEDLSVGRPEDEFVVGQTRNNFKLWHRNDAEDGQSKDKGRYEALLGRGEELMFPGFADILTDSGNGKCPDCHYRSSYGATRSLSFGGVILCGHCQDDWRAFQETLPQRTKEAFSEVELHPTLPPLQRERDCEDRQRCSTM